MLRLLTFCFLAMLFDGAGKSACCKQLMFFNFALICTHLPSKKKTENNPCILKMNIYRSPLQVLAIPITVNQTGVR